MGDSPAAVSDLKAPTLRYCVHVRDCVVCKKYVLMFPFLPSFPDFPLFPSFQETIFCVSQMRFCNRADHVAIHHMGCSGRTQHTQHTQHTTTHNNTQHNTKTQHTTDMCNTRTQHCQDTISSSLSLSLSQSLSLSLSVCVCVCVASIACCRSQEARDWISAHNTLVHSTMQHTCVITHTQTHINLHWSTHTVR